MDCMTGSDGGVKFVLFRDSLEKLDKQAINGDTKAEQLLWIMIHFSKLIDILSDTT
jgi:hypothetical protein